MRNYEWNKKYEVGFDPIDEQHKYLLGLVNKLLTHYSEDKDILELLLEELTYYVKFHFQSEENYMLIHDYQEYDDHKIEHDILIKEINSKVKQFRRGKIKLKDVIVFFIKSSMTHTLEVDRIVGRYLRKVTAED